MPTKAILPLRGAAIGACIGDSRVAGGWLTPAAGGASSRVENAMHWASFLSGARVEFPGALNFGVNSDTTAKVLARTADATAAAVAAKASFMVVYCGYNDRVGASPAALSTTLANYEAMAEIITQAGLMLIWVVDTPVGDTTYTSLRLSGTQLANHVAARHYLLERRHKPFEYVADPWPYMALQSATTGDAIAGMTYDGVHLSGRGAAEAVGRALAEQIQSIFPPATPFLTSNAEAYSTDNPRGCALLNPGFSGTSGTASSPATGSVPDSWTVPAPPSGVTCAASILTRGGRRLVQLVYGGTAADNAYHHALRQDVLIGSLGVAVGKTYELWWPAEWDADATNIAHVSMSLEAQSASTVRDVLGNTQASVNMFPTSAMSGVFKSDLLTLPVGTTGLRCRMGVQFRAAGAVGLALRVGGTTFAGKGLGRGGRNAVRGDTAPTPRVR